MLSVRDHNDQVIFMNNQTGHQYIIPRWNEMEFEWAGK